MEFNYNCLEKYNYETAVVASDGTKTTYERLVKIADNFGKRIPSRQVVLLICKNNVYSIASYIGFIRNGVVPLLVDYKLSKESINIISKTYHISYICLPTSFISDYSDKYTEFYTLDNYSLIKINENKKSQNINSDLALLIPTSGSTGGSKLVRISYNNLYENTKSISLSLSIQSTDRAITTMPMSYSYGLSIINTHLLNGSSLMVTNRSIMEKEFWLFFHKSKPTTFGGVPFIFKILKKLRFSEMNLESLRYITQAGGKLDLLHENYFKETCKKNKTKFYIMYGQTEATARMSVLQHNDFYNKSGSIGKPIPGGRFILKNELDQELKGDAEGELFYYGENVSMGYANKFSDLKLGDLNKGILKTGDQAERDSDGYYYIIGRKSRFVKIYGVRVGLDEVENFINGKGYECVCSGVDDNLKIHTTNSSYVDKIHSLISENRLIHSAGYSIKLIDSIPRSESGKVMYSKL
jgi:long-chain acyl-CoA synthetase